jgi:STE24 endopeptidase
MIHFYIYIIIIAFIIADFIFEQWLERLQYKSYDYPIPDNLQNIYDSETIQKHRQYHKEYYLFETKQEVLTFLITLAVFAFQLLGKLDNFLRSYIENEFLLTLSFFVIVSFIAFIINLPFSYYETFVIEQKYGFNTTTKKIFITDIFKTLAISIVIGVPLLWSIFSFYKHTTEYFWLFAWLVIMIFSLFITFFYSKLIVPLFNKQTPLPEGELKTAILEFCRKANFTVKNVYIINASKRSKKANAYFTGFGKNKRIVLFDTLLNTLSTEEIVAVLAHEIGHYKHKHIIKGFILNSLQMLFTLYILSLFINNVYLSMALGSKQASFHLGIISFGILYSPISLIISILFNYVSRKNEFQADKFTAKYGLSNQLINALKKISALNYSHLTPHPTYVKINYSHPPLRERIYNLMQ